MNLTHLHLLSNHLPIIGSILGAVVLIYALMAKSNSTKIAAYLLFIISGIGAAVTYFTGEAAEEAVENVQGVSKNMIGQHEDFALYAMISIVVLAFISLVAVFFTARRARSTFTFAFIVLFISIVSFALVARTGYLGGLIRHTELQATSAAGAMESGEQDND